ncbi:hypothetical protein NQ176_g813 [Zarea fungicola]|uniref:Uncharacterized protein n=1 Tax=Zarea fungicola TaxID=93591 RepID=A0ACC1NVB3_9HYPO|nr:hypothetical protein NQ176_g813 [Lecanicillium fungicola]
MSRTADIPDNFMLKWQSETHRGTKPVRRPMTACQGCRTSKVKCDGKQSCGHCTSRGVACVYSKSKGTTPNSGGGGAGIRKNSQNSQNTQIGAAHNGESMVMTLQTPPVSMPTGTIPKATSTDTNHNGGQAHPLDLQNSVDSEASLRDQTAPYRADAWIDSIAISLGSETPRTAQYTTYDAWQPTLDMPLGLVGNLTTSEITAIPDHSSDNLSSFHHGSDSEGSVQATISSKSSNGSASAASNGSVFASAKCQCRDKLAESIDRVNNAMIVHETNDVFEVTSEFMQSCQGIIDCKLCTIGCTDLVCLISFFQQTGSCFHYIAATDPKQQSIKLRFAGTYVMVSDPRMRLMAVMNLVQQAIDVLDAIGNRGQAMLKALRHPTALAITNIGYLENTIVDFKNTLDRVVAVAKRTAGDSS